MPEPKVEVRGATKSIPAGFYQWLRTIERDVRVWDLTPNEIKELITALQPASEPQEHPSTIDGTGEGVTGRKDLVDEQSAIHSGSASPFTNSDRLPLPDCPFCGGALTVTAMIPAGWNIRIGHADDCAIQQMSGVCCDTEADRDAFLSTWANRQPASEPSEYRRGVEEAGPVRSALLMARTWINSHDSACPSLIAPECEDGPWNECTCNLPSKLKVIDDALAADLSQPLADRIAREPTGAMIEAGLSEGSYDDNRAARWLIRDIWRSMFDAAKEEQTDV